MDPIYFQLLKSHCIVFTIMWSGTEECLSHRYIRLCHYCSFFWEKHVNILLYMMRAHRIGHIYALFGGLLKSGQDYSSDNIKILSALPFRPLQTWTQTFFWFLLPIPVTCPSNLYCFFDINVIIWQPEFQYCWNRPYILSDSQVEVRSNLQNFSCFLWSNLFVFGLRSKAYHD